LGIYFKKCPHLADIIQFGAGNELLKDNKVEIKIFLDSALVGECQLFYYFSDFLFL